jgi:endonuclease YncB( thermonuclease family)
MKMSVILACWLFYVGAVSADVYQSYDSDGRAVFFDRASSQSEQLKQYTAYLRQQQTISSVYDGDTVRFKNGQRVRLLGINAPEINSRYRSGEVGGPAAKRWLKKKLAGKTVLVEYDQQRRDKYQRQLVHLFLLDGEHINAAMIATGLVSSLVVPPNLRYADSLIKAEKQASLQKKGIWALKAYQPKSLTQLLKQKKSGGWQRYRVAANAIKHTKKYSRLIVNDKVDIRIPKANLDLFPKLDSYLDQALEVRGWASRKKGHYSILIRHPSAIIRR